MKYMLSLLVHEHNRNRVQLLNLVQVPASALSLHLQEVWNVISTQKDLDLPAHKVMVAHIRCKQIAAEQLAAVQADVAWNKLTTEALHAAHLVLDFGKRASALIESCLYGYERDAMYFVESVRTEHKNHLNDALRSALMPAFEAQRALLHTELLATFEAALERVGCDDDTKFVDLCKSLSTDLQAKYNGVILWSIFQITQGQ